ncbi:hypothetical protein FACS1894181_16850 [Bacteroidia bacterium]|nr:hypothetical protein FACS1894181_16850 [Bacteroidia bacterium]
MIRVAEKLSKNQIFEKFKINTNLDQLKMLKKQLSFFRFDIKIESDINIIAWFISEVFRIFFLLEPLIFHKIFLLIQKYKTELEKIYEFVGLIDSLQSINTLRNKQIDCCIPQYIEEGDAVSTNEVYHPLIKNCIKNTFSTENHSFLILGSNMSGKTTFMRTIAINVLLAQTVNTCFAKSFSLKKQKIWTSISLKDNLANQESYYLSEVLKIKDIIDHTASENHLIVIDELFKGTNTQERTAAAKAVLTYLSYNNENTILVASHDIELCDLLDNKKFITVHFSEKIENSDLSFPYTLNFGKPTNKNAIKILELYNYPEEITKDARRFSFVFNP